MAYLLTCNPNRQYAEAELVQDTGTDQEQQQYLARVLPGL